MANSCDVIVQHAWCMVVVTAGLDLGAAGVVHAFVYLEPAHLVTGGIGPWLTLEGVDIQGRHRLGGVHEAVDGDGDGDYFVSACYHGQSFAAWNEDP